jgi:cell division protein FtsL
MTTDPAVLSRRPGVELERVAQTPRHRPKLRPFIVFTITVVIAFFGMIYSRISLDRTAFELDELEERITAEEARFLDLELEVARLQNPARIDELADSLGLVYPSDVVPMSVSVVQAEPLDPDLRLAQLRQLLSAQP